MLVAFVVYDMTTKYSSVSETIEVRFPAVTDTFALRHHVYNGF